MDAWKRSWVASGLVCLSVGCASDRSPGTVHLSSYATIAPQATDAAAAAAIASPTAEQLVSAAAMSPDVAQSLDVALVQYQSPVAVADNSGLTLEQMLEIAFDNNPAIRELAATTQKAAGYRTQVGLYANPVIGYEGERVSHGQTDQHLAFIQQEIVTGGKLQLNRAVLNEALRAQLQELETQKLRVATDIKTGFYLSLQFQQQLAAIEGFAKLLSQGVEAAEQRMQAGEGSKIDLLQTRVQLQQLLLEQRQIDASLNAKRRELAALAGVPQWQSQAVTGQLPTEPSAIDWETVPVTLVAASPEYAAAQARIRQAAFAIRRHVVQPIPNLQLQLGAGRDNAVDAEMMTVQIGAPIPVFNRNQGNLAAARAEYCRAVFEAQRIENAIQARLAVAAGEYARASEAVTTYQQELLPAAQETLDLAEAAYRAGEQDFIQLLVTRRTYFDTNLGYISAQAQLAVAQAQIDGYLLSGALNAVVDGSGDASLREIAFEQQ